MRQPRPDDERLALSITHQDGSVTRWGGDEPDAGNIPSGLKFGTTIPGGFKDCSCSLARRIDIDYPDLQLFDGVRVYGPGNETVWEGRQQQFPRDHADAFSIAIGAVGWSAHLEDDASFREIYVDRDITQWAEASVQRQATLNASLLSWQAGTVIADNTGGIPALQTLVTGAWSAVGVPISEPWYSSQGIPIAALYYAWKRGPNIDNTDVNWAWQPFLSTDDAASSLDLTGNLRAAGPSSGTLTATGRRLYAAVQICYNASGTPVAAGNDGQQYSILWTCLAVYGTHGLTKRGTNTASGAQGFYASDVIADIVRRNAPKLTFTTGAAGTIEPTTFVIPHLVFKTPGTGADAVALVNGYHLFDWAVWERKKFYWQRTDADTATVWEARLSDGAQVSLEGDQATDLWNGVVITYTDPLGIQRLAGPPGSGCDTENAALADSSVTNPVNVAGLRRWAPLNLSVVTDANGATQLGAVWLAEHILPQKRGQIILTGRATCVQAGTRGAQLGDRPAWAVRAGDYIRLADHLSDEPRKIIETAYDDDARTQTLSIGTTPFKLDAILERLSVATQIMTGSGGA